MKTTDSDRAMKRICRGGSLPCWLWACLGAGLLFGAASTTLAQTTYSLSVDWMSLYSWGTVTSSPAGISCGAYGSGACSASFPANTTVTLTAIPLPGYALTSWYGSASGTNSTLSLTMTGNKTVATTWGPATSNILSVAVSPAGSGSVSSSPAGINCGPGAGQTNCSARFTANTTVALTATPAPGFSFVGWSGDINQAGSPLNVSMNGNVNLTAIFSSTTATLTVQKFGTGSGQVTSSAGGLNCGATCSVTVPLNTAVTLTAAPDAGSLFERWGVGGACATNITTCPIQVTRDMTVAVYFSKVLAPSSCFAQQWLEHVGTAQADSARAVASGPAGELYVVGTTAGAFGGPLVGSENAWLAKFDTNGATQWIRQLGNTADSGALAVCADRAGYVYLCGYTSGMAITNQATNMISGGADGLFLAGSSSAAWLAKYDSNGNAVWSEQLGAGVGASANALAVDAEGNVYVAGATSGNLVGAGPGQGETDAWVAKYDPCGYRVWLKQPADWNTQWGDGALGVAVDPLGNVFVAGERWVSTGTADGFLSKLDTEGREQWTRLFNGVFFTNGVFSGLVAVAADGCGNAIFAGGTDGDFRQHNLNGDFDAIIGKMDGNGNLLWGAQLGTDLAEAAYAVATDAAGNVYAAGPSYGALATPNPSSNEGIGAGEDLWFARFDPNGALQCLKQMGTDFSKSRATGIALDGAGNLFVTGSANGDLGGPSLGGNDGILARFAQGAGPTTSDLVLSMSSSPHPAAVNANLTYTLTVTNTGSTLFTNVTLTETLPPNAAVVSVTTSLGTTHQAGNVLTCTLGTLTNQAAATVSLTLKPTAAGLLTNQASLTSSPADLNGCNNTARSLQPVLAENAAPVLLWPSRQPKGPAGFTLKGLPLRSYELLTSTDLMNWTTLGSLVNSNIWDGLMPYLDGGATNLGRRFYRALLLGSVTNAPNLVPYRPSGWSDKMVVSVTTGATSDSPLLTSATPLYVNWAVLNNGTTAAATRFYTDLYVDGVLRDSWYIDPPLDVDYYIYVSDYPIGTLSAGPHTILLQTDSTDAITETNETDNQYIKSITVGP